jgi:hypothetical protein
MQIKQNAGCGRAWASATDDPAINFLASRYHEAQASPINYFRNAGYGSAQTGRRAN